MRPVPIHGFEHAVEIVRLSSPRLVAEYRAPCRAGRTPGKRGSCPGPACSTAWRHAAASDRLLDQREPFGGERRGIVEMPVMFRPAAPDRRSRPIHDRVADTKRPRRKICDLARYHGRIADRHDHVDVVEPSCCGRAQAACWTDPRRAGVVHQIFSDSEAALFQPFRAPTRAATCRQRRDPRQRTETIDFRRLSETLHVGAHSSPRL